MWLQQIIKLLFISFVLLDLSFDFFPLHFKKIKFPMNHFLATYIDFVQSVGFIFLTTLAAFLTRKLFLDNKKDNYIEAVEVKVD